MPQCLLPSAHWLSQTSARWLSLIGTTLGAVACSSPNEPRPPTTDTSDVSSGDPVPGFETYDEGFPALMRRWNIPGAAVAVAHEGKIVFSRGYGLADKETGRQVLPDTTFRIMSVTKVFTAALVMRLVEQGTLSLDDKVFELLPYPTPTYPGAQRDPWLADITVRHLLAHKGGWVSTDATNPIVGGRGFNPTNYQRQIAQIMGIPAPGTPDTIIRYMLGQPLQVAPGTQFSYSGLGYLLLGRIIELKTGMSYADALQAFAADAFTSTLAIAGSTRGELAADEAVYYDDPSAPTMASNFDGSSVPAPYAYSIAGWDSIGGWKMSALDCLRFMLALEGKNGLPQLLQSSSLSRMRTAPSPAEYYGLGWYTKFACANGNDQGHGGGSWGSKTWALESPNHQWHFVVFLNSLPTSAFYNGDFEQDAYRTIHSIDNGQFGDLPDLTWTTLSWSDWKRRWSLSPSAKPTDDPNNDGWSLLMEYAAGLTPVSEEKAAPLHTTTDKAGHVIVEYQRLPLDTEVFWSLETSNDGNNWTATPEANALRRVSSDGLLTITVNIGQASRVRLKVILKQTGDTSFHEVRIE